MRRRLGVLALLVGCGGHPEAARSVPAVAPKHVSAFELLVHGPDAVKAPRARLRRHGRAWLRADVPVMDQDPSPADDVVAVQEARPKRVRVLTEYDDARLLLWIPRDDLQTVIVRATAVAVGGTGKLGVTVQPGAALVVRTASDTAPRVTIQADGLSVTGDVPADAVGDVWEAVAIGEAPEATSSIDGGTAIKAAADRRAATLAITTGLVSVREIAVHGSWTEIETTGELIRVRGLVPTAALTGGFGYLMGGLLGDTYGLTDTPTVDLPGGTCLYDGVDGALVGINTVARTRYAAVSGDPAWIAVHVNTQWGMSGPYVHDEELGPEVRYEQCAPPLTSP